jgi:ketosteroid isomerase-like protein
MPVLQRLVVSSFAVLLIGSGAPLVSRAQSAAKPSVSGASADVSEVWALEDAYWRYVKAGDVTRYLTLWHDDFVGWPCGSEHPGTKATIGDWVKNIKDEGVRYRYPLTREGSVDRGDVVIVYYSTPMISVFPDGRVEGQVNGKDEARKLTHTWQRTPNGWKIIGGMCAPVVTNGQ